MDYSLPLVWTKTTLIYASVKNYSPLKAQELKKKRG